MPRSPCDTSSAPVAATRTPRSRPSPRPSLTRGLRPPGFFVVTSGCGPGGWGRTPAWHFARSNPKAKGLALSQLILPPEVQFSYELDAQLERLNRTRERAGWLREFDRNLKNLDQRLSLVKASEHSTRPGLVPGYWHVRRSNDPPAMDSYLPLTGPDGEFIEPHSGILEWLRGCDLQRDGALDDLRRQNDARERERQRNRERMRDDRMEEMATRIKAHDSPGVLFGDTKWTWRTSGRRGAHRG